MPIDAGHNFRNKLNNLSIFKLLSFSIVIQVLVLITDITPHLPLTNDLSGKPSFIA